MLSKKINIIFKKVKNNKISAVPLKLTTTENEISSKKNELRLDVAIQKLKK